MEKTLTQLGNEIHENAKSKGFFDEPKNIGEMLCLIHSEVSEALEADRKTHVSEGPLICVYDILDNQYFKQVFEAKVKNSFEDELADIVIRVLDLAEFKKIDLYGHILAKMRYNSLRPHKHGKKY